MAANSSYKNDPNLIKYYKINKARCPYLYSPLEKFFTNGEFWYLRKSKPEHPMIHKYFNNTNISGLKLEIVQIYRIFRDGEYSRYTPYRTNANRKLLWHGSRAANYSGIFSNGLVKSSPNAVQTGARFGRGVYFADTVAKSVTYCGLSRQQPNGFMLLCEVTLGNMMPTRSAASLQPNYDSMKAEGSICPDPKDDFTQHNGTVVPLGKPINRTGNYVTDYSEYIVYEEAQILLKYFVEIKLC